MSTDALLERYLNLLDQYTSLRTELGTLQSSIHQDIARANFSAERGIRYGQDHYDDRMRASRTIQVTSHTLESSSSSVPSSSSSSKAPSIPIFTTTTTTTTPTPKSATSTPTPDPPPPSSSSTAAAPQPPKNPLTMFGILVPPSLRTAQASAITMVSSVLPQLASVDAEMRELEICIRRARKKEKQQQRKREAQQQQQQQQPQQMARGGLDDASRRAALLAMAARDGPTPKGILREGPAPPYIEVRFAEEGE